MKKYRKRREEEGGEGGCELGRLAKGKEGQRRVEEKPEENSFQLTEEK